MWLHTILWIPNKHRIVNTRNIHVPKENIGPFGVWEILAFIDVPNITTAKPSHTTPYINIDEWLHIIIPEHKIAKTNTTHTFLPGDFLSIKHIVSNTTAVAIITIARILTPFTRILLFFLGFFMVFFWVCIFICQEESILAFFLFFPQISSHKQR